MSVKIKSKMVEPFCPTMTKEPNDILAKGTISGRPVSIGEIEEARIAVRKAVLKNGVK